MVLHILSLVLRKDTTKIDHGKGQIQAKPPPQPKLKALVWIVGAFRSLYLTKWD